MSQLKYWSRIILRNRCPLMSGQSYIQMWLHCSEANVILRLGWKQIVSVAAAGLSLQGKVHQHSVSFDSLSPFTISSLIVSIRHGSSLDLSQVVGKWKQIQLLNESELETCAKLLFWVSQVRWTCAVRSDCHIVKLSAAINVHHP